MKIVYIDRIQIDAFKVVDTIKEINGSLSFKSGDLLYFKKNQFEYFSISEEFIIEIDGKAGNYIKNHSFI